MSRAKTSLAALAVVLSACTTSPDPTDQAEQDYARAVEAALQPATPEEVAAANRADPLTKANFWAKEHSKDPDNLEKALTFANALRGIGSDERAIEVLSQVLVVHPGDPDLLIALGKALSAQNDLVASARAFEQATRTAPERAEAWAALGTSLDKLDRHKDAQLAYTQALVLAPTRTSTLTNYGLSLALSGDLKGAEEKLRLAAAQPDADLRVTENLALILGLQGKYDEMAEISSRHAPQGVVEQNTKLLQDMIQPVRSWDALETELPAAKTAAPPVQKSKPKSSAPPVATSKPEETPPEASSTGLRLRRSGD
ncbi:tetratricopeptide repeat protein [Hyphomonas pacifica]|uniref:Uncharacterized protein n=1 Tax=Hyphomonas pacifica TaxID=1280941 RepID=A0A062TWB6_9PROT|nr:tetratricopeptide repeat protein [Hyphomonas pacifica]KCZ48372.1 hypothetical protein HY2_03985 [Hyphomonas pacifica]RAN31684.1 hypothetical protein HY3_03680 [Hyphomonas pacifica]